MVAGEKTDRRPSNASWAVAIHATPEDDRPLGSGVLIGRRRVLTSAHVVKDRNHDNNPRHSLWVAFPMSRSNSYERLAVESIKMSGERSQSDVAIITLSEDAPAEADAAAIRTVNPQDLVDLKWWAFGFPGNSVFGATTQGLIQSNLAYGWIRLTTLPGNPIEQGYSGAGVWSSEYQAVVALIGQADPVNGTGLAVGIQQISSDLPTEDLESLAAWKLSALDEDAQAAWGWSLVGDPEGKRHWRPRARGVSVDSERGYRFRGRTTALETIVSWLEQDDPARRVLVVTGSPGVGKSAVLGRIVTTADVGVQGELPLGDSAPTAPTGSVACAVHAKGKTALDVATEIARAAGARLPARVEDLPIALQEQLSKRPNKNNFTVVVDALDEATDGMEVRRIVRAILLPLAVSCARDGVRLVVGTRRRDERGDIVGALGHAALVIDLDSVTYFSESDLSEYALACLQLTGDERVGNPYADTKVALPIASKIAAISHGNFLAAGLLARSHGLYDVEPVSDSSLQFGTSVSSALDEYLDRLPPLGTVQARRAFCALAFSDPPGFSLLLWHRAMAALGWPVSLQDLQDFTESAGANFLIQSTGHEQDKTFRLFHRALDEKLLADRSEVSHRLADERKLVESFVNVADESGWTRAEPYLRRSLAVHAERAGELEKLLLNDAYLAHADITRLMGIVDRSATAPASTRARMLVLTPQAIHASPGVRLSMLKLTGMLENVSPAVTLVASSPYSSIWANTPPRTERVFLEGHTQAIRDICAVPRLGQVLLASAGDDSTVRLWDPLTGLADFALAASSPLVRLCVAGDNSVSLFLAAAGQDGSLTVWDALTGAQLNRIVATTDSRLRSLCAIKMHRDTFTLIAGHDDGSIRLYDGLSGATIGTLLGHEGPVVSLCSYASDERFILASGGFDSSIRIWDVSNMEEIRKIVGHRLAVRSMTFLGRRDGTVILAAGGDESKIRLWDPWSGAAVGEPLTHGVHVWGLCGLPTVGGDDRLLSVCENERSLRIWNLDETGPIWQMSAGSNWITGACAMPISPIKTLIATTAHEDDTIRIWDPLMDSSSAQDILFGGFAVWLLKRYKSSIVLFSKNYDEINEWDFTTGRQRVNAPRLARVEKSCEVLTNGTSLVGAAFVVRKKGEKSDCPLEFTDINTGKLVWSLRDTGIKPSLVQSGPPVVKHEVACLAAGLEVFAWIDSSNKLRVVNPFAKKLSSFELPTVSSASATVPLRLPTVSSASPTGPLSLKTVRGGQDGDLLHVNAPGEYSILLDPATLKPLRPSPNLPDDAITPFRSGADIVCWDGSRGVKLIDVFDGRMNSFEFDSKPHLVRRGPIIGGKRTLISADRRSVQIWAIDPGRLLVRIPTHHKVTAVHTIDATMIISLDAGLVRIDLTEALGDF